jgi:hypothetical protein
MSDTVALAADTASMALTCVALFSERPVGSRMRTMHSQNAMRMRKNMVPCSPWLVGLSRTSLAAGLENAVRPARLFLSIFETNAICLFRKFEMSAFA